MEKLNLIRGTSELEVRTPDHDKDIRILLHQDVTQVIYLDKEQAEKLIFFLNICIEQM